jgi:glycosyltransferase involved in cell wall biosynthesis
MASVDGVIAGSPYIENYAIQFNSSIINIPTSYDDLLGQNHHENTPPIIVWIGNWGNACYLKPLLPALESLSQRHSFTLRLIGGQDIHEIQSSQVSIDYVDWSRAAEAQLLPQSDIGIMPLLNQDYEKGKCAFKLIQYMSAGLAVIASPIGMNNSVVTEDIGKLAETHEEWFDALDTLLSDSTLQAEMGKAAYKKYQSQFSRTINANRLAALI